MTDRLLDNVVEKYLEAKITREHILNQNGANLVYTHGKDVAQKLGLDKEAQSHITPFPGRTFIMGGTRSRLANVVTALGLLGAGAAGPLAWMAYRHIQPPAAEQTDPEPGETQPPGEGSVGIEIS